MKTNKLHRIILAFFLLPFLLSVSFKSLAWSRALTPHHNSSLQIISLMNRGWKDLYRKGRVSFDREEHKSGKASLRIDPSQGGMFSGAYLEIPFQDFRDNGFAITFKVSSWKDLDSFFIGWSSNRIRYNSFEDFFFIDLKYYLSSINDNEWQTITISPSNLIPVGKPTWQNIGTIIIRATTNLQNGPSLWVDEISTFQNQSRSSVVIAFDDGHLSSYINGKIVMDRYSFPGVLYIIPDYIGEPGFVNFLQLKDMEKSNWDIGGHSDYNLTTLSDTQLIEEIRHVHTFLKRHNFKGSKFFALPYGQYNEKVTRYLQPYFPYIRPNYHLHQPNGYIIPETLNSQVIIKDTLPDQIIHWIDRAVQNKDLLILVFHKIEAHPIYETEYKLADFIRILEHLKQNSIPVTTLSDFFGHRP